MLETSNTECNGGPNHENTTCTAVCEDSPTNIEETKCSSASEETQKPYVSRKVTLSNRKQSCSSLDEKVEEPKEKRSKWGNFATAKKNSQNINISTSSLKSWFPDFKLINETAPVKEISGQQQTPSVSEEKFNSQFPSNDEQSYKQFSMMSNNESQQDASLEEPVEHGPVSNIIFIQNLVRPFTLLQLKDLLKQSGNLIEEEFWIDKIKSKCIVKYETEEAAVNAKNRLNNTRWPLSNPKILIVQCITENDVEFHKSGGVSARTVREPSVETEPLEIKTSAEENKRKDRDCRKEREKLSHMPKREWDQHKFAQDSPEKERVNKENEKYKTEKKEKKESRRRLNDNTPAKLLDDLFQKTKSPPCIYWLPLTEEQVRMHAEEKRLQRSEPQKRSLDEKVPEDRDRKNKVLYSGHKSRERETTRSSSRSRSPVTRRR